MPSQGWTQSPDSVPERVHLDRDTQAHRKHSVTSVEGGRWHGEDATDPGVTQGPCVTSGCRKGEEVPWSPGRNHSCPHLDPRWRDAMGSNSCTALSEALWSQPQTLGVCDSSGRLTGISQLILLLFQGPGKARATLQGQRAYWTLIPRLGDEICLDFRAVPAGHRNPQPLGLQSPGPLGRGAYGRACPVWAPLTPSLGPLREQPSLAPQVHSLSPKLQT